MHPLQLKSARYDSLSQSVLINSRKAVVEIAHDGLEALIRKPLNSEEAIRYVLTINRKIAQLASIIPADDGKIHITKKLLLNDGIWE